MVGGCLVGRLADWLRELGSPYEFRGGRVNGCFGGARDHVMRRVVVRCVVLCCVVLHCVVVGCGVVCCIALYHGGFWCVVSGGAVVCCAVLGCVKLRCVALGFAQPGNLKPLSKC